MIGTFSKSGNDRLIVKVESVEHRGTPLDANGLERRREVEDGANEEVEFEKSHCGAPCFCVQLFPLPSGLNEYGST